MQINKCKRLLSKAAEGLTEAELSAPIGADENVTELITQDLLEDVTVMPLDGLDLDEGLVREAMDTLQSIEMLISMEKMMVQRLSDLGQPVVQEAMRRMKGEKQ